MNKKILVADDEPNVLLLLRSRLESAGYQVITAQDGEECLNKIGSEKPDLLVLDIMMPKMDGYNVLVNMKELKESLGLPDIPVIVLTARGDSKVRELIEKENISDFIVKPYKGDELVAKIKKVIG